jgi:hypothetical protein
MPECSPFASGGLPTVINLWSVLAAERTFRSYPGFVLRRLPTALRLLVVRRGSTGVPP